MRPCFTLLTAGLLASGVGCIACPGQAATVLNVGIAADPGVLDPAQSGNFIDRNIFAALCDKLVDTDADMNYVPQLATSWEWSDDRRTLTLQLRNGVQFQDGTHFNADAVKANLERYKTMPRSLRKAELASLDTVEAVGPLTVQLHLSTGSWPVLVIMPRAGTCVRADRGQPGHTSDA